MRLLKFAANLAKISILSYRNTRFRHYTGKNYTHTRIAPRRRQAAMFFVGESLVYEFNELNEDICTPVTWSADANF